MWHLSFHSSLRACLWETQLLLFSTGQGAVWPQRSRVKAAQEGQLETAQGPSRQSVFQAEPAVKVPATSAAAAGPALHLSRILVMSLVLRTSLPPQKAFGVCPWL